MIKQIFTIAFALSAFGFVIGCSNPVVGNNDPGSGTVSTPTPPPTISGALVSLTLVTPPTNVTYFTGDSFDISGISITANYEKGSKTVDPKDLVVNDFDSSKPGYCYITFSYAGVKCKSYFKVDIGLTLDVAQLPSYTSTGTVHALKLTGQLLGGVEGNTTLAGDWQKLNYWFWDIKTLILPDHSGSIPSGAIQGLAQLETLIAPQATRLDDSALYYSLSNDALKSLVIPKCASIGAQALANRKYLDNITLPEVTSIGKEAFRGCYALSSISLPKVTVIGDFAFASCFKLSSAEIPLMSDLGNSVFTACSKLTKLTMPNLKSVGQYCLSGTGFTSIDFPNLTSTGEGAFSSCSDLVSVSLPKLATLAERAFLYCTKLSTVTLPLVTATVYQSFYGCTQLSHVNMPLLTSVGGYSFQGCGFTKLDSSTFICAASIVLLNYAFSENALLATVNLPAVQSVDSYAFAKCPLLKILVLAATTKLAYNSIQTCAKLETIYAPNLYSFDTEDWANLASLKELVFQRTVSSTFLKAAGMANAQSAAITLYLGPTDYASKTGSTWGLLNWKEIKEFSSYTLPKLQ